MIVPSSSTLKHSKNQLLLMYGFRTLKESGKVKTSVCRRIAIVIHSGHDGCLSSMGEENVFEIHQVNVHYHPFVFVSLS